jgi:hypothetical protein
MRRWLVLTLFLLAGCSDLMVGTDVPVPDLAVPDGGAACDAFFC